MCCQEVLLVQKVSELYHKISTLQSLKPSKDVNSLFSQLVLTCAPPPPSPPPIDVSKLGSAVQKMRSHLIKLCGEAEALLEHHYSSILASHENPLENLSIFPYYSNYLKLAHLEFSILERHAQPSKVAFVGSGALPFTSIIMASKYLPATEFHNFDVDPSANAKAAALVAGDRDLERRMVFHTADIMEVTGELRGFQVVFLAALVGMEREEKVKVIEHLGKNMGGGALLMLRSAYGARAFLYPVVEARDLQGFEILTVFHPTDEVINSVVLARL
ncbi:probable nicotianamine synthase 4 [Momordica charantia]|uniref:Nicotianamine synthase n=1 Tax=Momordica charantia TaxID=3673 RepID=A0A6J1DTD8_MOMCH|nr:probable nicotianamine synthase 4 [Momordica charantia]